MRSAECTVRFQIEAELVGIGHGIQRDHALWREMLNLVKFQQTIELRKIGVRCKTSGRLTFHRLRVPTQLQERRPEPPFNTILSWRQTVGKPAELCRSNVNANMRNEAKECGLG